eukprot:1298372-Rhodomonas_salina.1
MLKVRGDLIGKGNGRVDLPLSCYACATCCPVPADAMLLLQLRYHPMRRPPRHCLPTGMLRQVQFSASLVISICLLAAYAKSGTGIAYGTVSLRASYAKSSTGIATHTVLRSRRYTMSGTDTGYGTTRRS